MIWLFKHVMLPQGARTGSYCELTNPPIPGATGQILLGTILENPDRPLLLQEALSI